VIEMATIRKRGNAYQIDYFDPSGKRIRETFKKKKDAEAELGKRISLIAENRYLDVKKDYKTPFGELLKKYEENFQHQRGFKGSKKAYLKNFKEYFKAETLMANIRYVDVDTYQNHLRQKITVRGTIRKIVSINREINCLHHVFVKGVEWEMIEQSPFDRGKALIEKENNSRTRYLSEDEIPRLLPASSPHLQNIVVCAMNTGMRRGEILSLRWDQIRDGQIYLTDTKTDTPRQIPINDTLNELFKNIRKQQRVGTKNVFTYSLKGKRRIGQQFPYVINPEGSMINNLRSSFHAALRRSGIQDFKFHDLRHTFASHMIKRGASLKEIQELLGHKTMTMTLRYAHLSQEHKKKAVNLLNDLVMSQNVTNPAFNTSIDTPQTAITM
jgi:integrase